MTVRSTGNASIH